jgi:O-antigen/teichoic acid export membrane protein
MSSPAPSSALAVSAASGIKWTTSATAITTVLTVVQGLVVARFLGPGQYGLMAAAVVVVGLGKTFADGGMSAAVVTRQMSRETLSSLFWFNMATGFAIALLVLLSAPLVADFYRAPGVAEIVRWAALIFVLAPAGAQFGQLLHRELDFRRLALQQVIPAAFGTAVAVPAAASGAGAVSLIWAMLATTAVNSIMTAWVAWRRWPPTHGFSWTLLRPHFGFGAYQMGERALNFAQTNVDYVLIGRFLGPAALGSYSLAYNLVSRPLFVINPTVTRVAFPIFARRQDDDGALRRGYLQVVRLIAYVTLPLLAGLAIVAPEFVRVALGAKWESSVAIMQILCLLGIFRCLANPVGSVFLAKDRPDIGFKGNAVSFVVMVGLLLIAVQYGLIATAWAGVGVTVALWITWLTVLRRLIDLRWSLYVTELAKPVLLTGAMCLLLVAARAALGGLPAGALLATLVAGAALFYLSGALILDRPWLAGLWRLFRARPEPVPATVA